MPSSQPSGLPSSVSTKSAVPSPIASVRSEWPTSQPSEQPISWPSSQPTCLPSWKPSSVPTFMDTVHLTTRPTELPTDMPSVSPSILPSAVPSPTCLPTAGPTRSLPFNTLVSVNYTSGVVQDFKIVLPFMFANAAYGNDLSNVVIDAPNVGTNYVLSGAQNRLSAQVNVGSLVRCASVDKAVPDTECRSLDATFCRPVSKTLHSHRKSESRSLRTFYGAIGSAFSAHITAKKSKSDSYEKAASSNYRTVTWRTERFTDCQDNKISFRTNVTIVAFNLTSDVLNFEHFESILDVRDLVMTELVTQSAHDFVFDTTTPANLIVQIVGAAIA
eukprot:gene30675-37926_t